MPLIDHDAVCFEQNLNPYKQLLTIPGADKNVWRDKAAYIHHLRVRDELFKLMTQIIFIGNSISNPSARMHLNFGVGRRSKAIWHAMGSLIETVTPDRKEPLTHDDVENASRDLNTIYIHIRGLMDNLAWCIIHILDIKARPQNVGLFKKTILNDPRTKKLALTLSALREWDSDLSGRRDPAAHQIPLTIPPAFLNQDQATQFTKIMLERDQEEILALQKIQSGQESTVHFDRMEKLFSQAENLGTFCPLFCHDDTQGLFPIYPTVPEDIGKMLIAADHALDFICEVK